jgi:hypothetical protein
MSKKTLLDISCGSKNFRPDHASGQVKNGIYTSHGHCSDIIFFKVKMSHFQPLTALLVFGDNSGLRHVWGKEVAGG